MKKVHNAHKRLILLFSLVLIIIMLASCASRVNTDASVTTTPVARRELPLIWRVSDDNGYIYLFGSIHVAKEDLYPLDDVIEEAYAESDYLALEMDLVAFEEKLSTDIDFAQEIMPYLFYTDGSTIEDVIGPELYAQGMELLTEKQQDYSETMLSSCTPYMWISLLSDISAREAGLDTMQGVDYYFTRMAHESGKPVLEVEGLYSHLEMFDDFSEEANKDLINSYLQSATSPQSSLLLYDNWQRGQLDYIALLLTLEADTEYNNAMSTSRNLKMADVAEQYLADGKKVFYVVGVAHMLGEGGLVDLLTERGYQVDLLE